MKKFIKLTLIFTLILINVFPVHAFASEEVAQWEDADFSQEVLAEIYALGTELVLNEKATGLIMDGIIALSHKGTTLLIVGEVNCTDEVKKCGFKELVIQRRASSAEEWVDIATYEDLYFDAPMYSIQKTLAVSSGYYYRATCIFYAKKNILSVQKIEETSNVVNIF